MVFICSTDPDRSWVTIWYMYSITNYFLVLILKTNNEDHSTIKPTWYYSSLVIIRDLKSRKQLHMDKYLSRQTLGTYYSNLFYFVWNTKKKMFFGFRQTNSFLWTKLSDIFATKQQFTFTFSLCKRVCYDNQNMFI